MDLEQVKDWIHRIFITEEEEIDCGEVYEVVARFVDLEISGEEAALLMPAVKQHLDQCPQCYELYDALKAIARLEEEDELPDVEEAKERLLAAIEAEDG